MKIYKKDCSPQDAEDKTLPLNSYLVSYIDEGHAKYDICISHKRVEIFDYYYDNFYKVLSIEWTKGSVNPKLWQDPNLKKKK
jgi:hypothetical protein